MYELWVERPDKISNEVALHDKQVVKFTEAPAW